MSDRVSKRGREREREGSMKSTERGCWEGWGSGEADLAQALRQAHESGEDGKGGAEVGARGRGIDAMLDALRALGVSVEEATARLEPLVWGVRVALALLHPDQGEVVEVSMGVVEAWAEGLGARDATQGGDDAWRHDEDDEDDEDDEETGGAEAGALLKLTLALLGVLEEEMEEDTLKVSGALWQEMAGRRGRGARDDEGEEEQEGAVERMRRALWCGALSEARTLWRGLEQAAGAALYLQAGALYERMEDWERARGMYGLALKEEARDEGVQALGLAGIGRAKAGGGDEEGARRALEMAFQGGYEHPRDAVQLAWLLLRAGKLAEAERWGQTAAELGARSAWLGRLNDGIAEEALARAWACIQSSREAEAEGCLALAKQYVGAEAQAHVWACEAALALTTRRVQATQDALLESLCAPNAARFGRRLGDWLLRAAFDDEVAHGARAQGWLRVAGDAVAQLPDVAHGDALRPWQMALVAAERLVEGDVDTAHMAAGAGLQLLMGETEEAPEALRIDAAHLWLIQAEAARRVDDYPRAATMLLHALRFSAPGAPLAAATFLRLAPCLHEQELEAWLEALAERLSPEALEGFQAALDPPPTLRISRALPPTAQPQDPLYARLRACLQPLGVHLSDDALSPVVEDILDARDLQRAEGLSERVICRLLAARLRRRQSPAAPRAAAASSFAPLPSSSGQPLRTLDPASTLPWQRTQSARASDAIAAKPKRPK
jgi:hypothetical protein